MVVNHRYVFEQCFFVVPEGKCDRQYEISSTSASQWAFEINIPEADYGVQLYSNKGSKTKIFYYSLIV